MSFRPSSISLKGSPSSNAWLSRQFHDPFVKQRLSHLDAYRSRSAFKLLELNERWQYFIEKPDVKAVVDLGAAPGGWSQVVAGKLGWTGQEEPSSHLTARRPSDGGDRRAIKRPGTWSSRVDKLDEQRLDELEDISDDHHSSVGRHDGRATIIAVDLLHINPIPGVRTIQADFLSPKTRQIVNAMLASSENPEGKADVILADMAANSSGNKIRDSSSSLEICSAVWEFASHNLRTAENIGRRRGGVLLLKHFSHPLLQNFRVQFLNPNFNDVHYIKPYASRAASSEGYWLCQGWKGISS